MAMLMTSTTLFGSPVLAESEVPITVPISVELPREDAELISEENESNYVKAQGIIKEVVKDGETVTLIVENQEKSLVTHFPLTIDVEAYSSATTEKFAMEDYAEGLQVEVFYDKNKPIMMIYPAIIVPELVIVHEKGEMGQVKVAKFDKNWLSLDGQLQLKIDDNTELVNQKGKAITKEELADKELLVFYTIETKSLPAQTTPTKIVALDPLDTVQSEIDFKDIEGHWAEASIIRLVSNDIVQGVNAQEFQPNNKVSRAEFASMLTKALGLVPHNGVIKDAFTDVNQSKLYYQDVFAAHEAGIINGYDGKFRPADSITREEMIVMVVRALEYINGKQSADLSVLSNYIDKNDVGNWAIDDVAIAVENGLIKGTTSTTIVPKGIVTRSQAVVVVEKLFDVAQINK